MVRCAVQRGFGQGRGWGGEVRQRAECGAVWCGGENLIREGDDAGREVGLALDGELRHLMEGKRRYLKTQSSSQIAFYWRLTIGSQHCFKKFSPSDGVFIREPPCTALRS